MASKACQIFQCIHWGLGIVGLTAFVVIGGTVGCRNGNLWWHRDDVIGGRAYPSYYEQPSTCLSRPHHFPGMSAANWSVTTGSWSYSWMKFTAGTTPGSGLPPTSSTPTTSGGKPTTTTRDVPLVEVISERSLRSNGRSEGTPLKLSYEQRWCWHRNPSVKIAVIILDRPYC